MRKEQPQGMSKVVAGVIAAGFLAFALYGVVTGDLSSRRHPSLDRASNPLFFWAYIGLFASVGIYASLVGLGVVKMPPPREAGVVGTRRDMAQRLAFLALLASGGSAYAWWTERSIVSPSVMNEIMGWVALGALGLAAWPPVLPPGRVRTVLRAAGAAAFLAAALAIFRLTR